MKHLIFCLLNLAFFLNTPLFAKELPSYSAPSTKMYIQPEQVLISETGLAIAFGNEIFNVQHLHSDCQGIFVLEEDLDMHHHCLNGHPKWCRMCGGCAAIWCPFCCKCNR